VARMRTAAAKPCPGASLFASPVVNPEGVTMPTMTAQPVRFQTIDGVRIRYADTGGSRKQAVDARLMVIDAGHFAWEEAPDVYASAIAETVSAAAT
jgi:hypothetical protein